MPSILVIEDDPLQRSALEEFLGNFLAKQYGKDGFAIYTAGEASVARSVINDRSIDIVLSDLMLPDGRATDIVKEFRKKTDAPFLIMTGQPSIETAVEAIRMGATDYLLKPVDLGILKSRVQQFLETSRLKDENRRLKARLSETFTTKNVIGNSPSLKAVLDKVQQVAPADVTVLLEGESGTGKELIANLIHENSSRAGKEFIKVNCGALTKTILESELFGSVKGAYTGADRDRAGLFEAANGGTIFLDEIGEMDLESQVRLLRVIEEREVMRVGSTKPVSVDVRIITATNRGLINELNGGRFREDLYYRLAVIKLTLPSLRERREDIPLLFNHFITQFNDKYDKSVTGLSPDLLKFFQSYDWPGNIRQFRNVLEGMVVLAREDILNMRDLPPEMLAVPARTSDKTPVTSIVPGVTLADYEKAIIEKNLTFTGGIREKTAKILGISERTLYRKIREYNLQ